MKIILKSIIGVKIVRKKYSANENKGKDSKAILGQKEIMSHIDINLLKF
jgi:ribosomal protein S19E (S16A)